jgi:6-phosphogluconolactonase
MIVPASIALCMAAASLAPAANGQPMTPATTQRPNGLLVYVGTYTDRGSKGIYAYRLDEKTGALAPVGLVAEAANPTFLALHPNHRYLYAVNEVEQFDGKKGGGVTAYEIDRRTGRLRKIDSESTIGTGPCHITVDHAGKNVLVANYNSGSAAVLPIRADGGVGPATGFVQHEGSSVDKSRQEGPHAHCANLDAANRFAFVADLGLDKVLIYRFDGEKGTLTPNTPAFVKIADGSGPRHMAFHPNGRFAYVISELGNTVTAMRYDADTGALAPIQTLSTLPDGFAGKSYCAEIAVDPAGRFLYGSNRGDDSLAIFAIDPRTGRLTPAGHQSTLGKFPRNFALTPSGDLLLAANQDSDSIYAFRVDKNTGQLTRIGGKTEVSRPVCIVFVP